MGSGTITALIRVEGRPLGVIANNPLHLGGAIDAAAAEKAPRFMQLCDAYDLPILSLCDTPGFMVGPDVETEAQVRHCSRLFVTAANIGVPMFTIVLRKDYGLGAQAATGGLPRARVVVSWPTGEFGGMGLEATCGWRSGVSSRRSRTRAIGTPIRATDRRALRARQGAEHGGALRTRRRDRSPRTRATGSCAALKSLPLRQRSGAAKRRPNVDAW